MSDQQGATAEPWLERAGQMGQKGKEHKSGGRVNDGGGRGEVGGDDGGNHDVMSIQQLVSTGQRNVTGQVL